MRAVREGLSKAGNMEGSEKRGGCEYVWQGKREDDDTTQCRGSCSALDAIKMTVGIVCQRRGEGGFSMRR